jgi:phenylacetate-coenzyme A ligase PaaK-like adenylate-forming protein
MAYTDEKCNLLGMHIPENRLLIDAVDPDTLEPVGVGNVGIDIVSTLYNVGEKPATILIGYSHNDLIRILDVGKCGCGRTYKMIEWPLIRREDIVHVAGQNINVRLGIESAISNRYPFLTKEYLVIHKPIDVSQTKPYLEIRIETKKPGLAISENERRDVERRIWSHVISNPAAESIIFSQSESNIQFMDRGHLFEGYEKYNKPGKPIRLIKI